MTTPKARKDTENWRNIEEGNVKWINHFRKQFGSFFKKMKHAATLWPSNYNPGDSKKIEDLRSHANLYVDVYSNFIPNSQKLQIIRIDFSRRMAKQTVAYLQSWKTEQQNRMDYRYTQQPREHEIKWKKPISVTNCMIPFIRHSSNDKPIDIKRLMVTQLRREWTRNPCG